MLRRTFHLVRSHVLADQVQSPSSSVYSSKHFRKKLCIRQNRVPRALERSRVSCDPERVEVLLKLNGPAVADRPDVVDLCFALLSLPVKPEVIEAESHDSLAAVALKDFVGFKNEFVKTRR